MACDESNRGNAEFLGVREKIANHLYCTAFNLDTDLYRLNEVETSAAEQWLERADAILAIPELQEALRERDALRAALLSCARQAEALKRECGMDPESPQAIRNAQYQNISTTAHIALGTIRGPSAAIDAKKGAE